MTVAGEWLVPYTHHSVIETASHPVIQHICQHNHAATNMYNNLTLPVTELHVSYLAKYVLVNLHIIYNYIISTSLNTFTVVYGISICIHI